LKHSITGTKTTWNWYGQVEKVG